MPLSQTSQLPVARCVEVAGLEYEAFVSPCGRKYAIPCPSEGCVAVIDLHSGERLLSIRFPAGWDPEWFPCVSCTFSSTNGLLAAVLRSEVVVWDLAIAATESSSVATVCRFTATQSRCDIDFSPDASMVTVMSEFHQKPEVWRIAHGAAPSLIHKSTSPVSTFCGFSCDSAAFILLEHIPGSETTEYSAFTRTVCGFRYSVIDLAAGVVTQRFDTPVKRNSNLEFAEHLVRTSPDLIVAGNPGMWRFDIHSGAAEELRLPHAFVRRIASSPSGDKLCIATPAALEIYLYPSLQPLASMQYPLAQWSDRLCALAWATDVRGGIVGCVRAGAGHWGDPIALYVWDAPSAADELQVSFPVHYQHRDYPGKPTPVHLCFSSDGRWLASASSSVDDGKDGDVIVWSVASQGLVPVWSLALAFVRAVQFLVDDRLLLLDRDGMLTIVSWEAGDPQCKATITTRRGIDLTGQGSITLVQLCRGGRWASLLVAGYVTQFVDLTPAIHGDSVATLLPFPSAARLPFNIAASADGSELACVEYGGSKVVVRGRRGGGLYHTVDGSIVRDLRSPDDECRFPRYVSYSPVIGGPLAVTFYSGSSGAVCLFGDGDSTRVVRPWPPDAVPCFSSDGRLLFTGLEPVFGAACREPVPFSCVRVADLQLLYMVDVAALGFGRPGLYALQGAMHCDGTGAYLASAANGHRGIQLWDAASGALLCDSASRVAGSVTLGTGSTLIRHGDVAVTFSSSIHGELQVNKGSISTPGRVRVTDGHCWLMLENHALVVADIPLSAVELLEVTAIQKPFCESRYGALLMERNWLAALCVVLGVVPARPCAPGDAFTSSVVPPETRLTVLSRPDTFAAVKRLVSIADPLFVVKSAPLLVDAFLFTKKALLISECLEIVTNAFDAVNERTKAGRLAAPSALWYHCTAGLCMQQWGSRAATLLASFPIQFGAFLDRNPLLHSPQGRLCAYVMACEELVVAGSNRVDSAESAAFPAPPNESDAVPVDNYFIPFTLFADCSWWGDQQPCCTRQRPRAVRDACDVAELTPAQAPPPRRPSFLQLLVATGRPELFGNTIAHAVVQFKWQTFGRDKFSRRFGWFLAEMVLLVTFSLLLSRHSATDIHTRLQNVADEGRDVVLFVLSLIVLALSGRGMWQEQRELQYLGRQYLDDVWNWMHVCQMLLAWAGVLCFYGGSRHADVLLGLAMYLGWFGVLYYLQPYDATGPLVRMILGIVAASRAMLAVLGIAVLASSSAFYMMVRHASEFCDDSGSGTCNDAYFDPAATLYTMFNMLILGSFDDSAFRLGEYAIVLQVLFVLSMVFVSIVLLNLLIALMGSAFGEIESRSENELTLLRAKIVLEEEMGMSEREKCNSAWFPAVLHMLVPEGSLLKQIDVQAQLGELRASVQHEIAASHAATAAQLEALKGEVFARLDKLTETVVNELRLCNGGVMGAVK